MLPPSRMSAASRLNALRNARCAASPIAECGSVRYHGPLWPVVTSIVTPLGRFFSKCVFASSRISSPLWSGTSRNVSFANAWLAITVFVPCPWYPPPIPLISAVGRAQMRSTELYPASPKSSGTPVSSRISLSPSTGSLRHASRSQSSSGLTRS